MNQLSIPRRDAWYKHPALPWQQAHCNFPTGPVSIVGSIITNHRQLSACPAGSLCVHSSVLIPWPRWPRSTPCIPAKALVMTYWHIWRRRQGLLSWWTCYFKTNITDKVVSRSQCPYVDKRCTFYLFRSDSRVHFSWISLWSRFLLLVVLLCIVLLEAVVNHTAILTIQELHLSLFISHVPLFRCSQCNVTLNKKNNQAMHIVIWTSITMAW